MPLQMTKRHLAILQIESGNVNTGSKRNEENYRLSNYTRYNHLMKRGVWSFAVPTSDVVLEASLGLEASLEASFYRPWPWYWP